MIVDGELLGPSFFILVQRQKMRRKKERKEKKIGDVRGPFDCPHRTECSPGEEKLTGEETSINQVILVITMLCP